MSRPDGQTGYSQVPRGVAVSSDSAQSTYPAAQGVSPEPSFPAADAVAEQNESLSEPPVQFPGIHVNAEPGGVPYQHRPFDQFLAYAVALTAMGCLFALIGGLFFAGLLEPRRVADPSLGPRQSIATAQTDSSAPGPGRGRTAGQRESTRQTSDATEPGFDFSVLPDSFGPDEAATGNPTETPGSQFATPSEVATSSFASNVDFQPRTTIDELVMRKLTKLKIEPAKLCTDEVFVRRLYVDALGTLPTSEEARTFLDDPDPDKRAKLVEQVLQRPEFADYWAMKWCDVLRVKAEFPIKLWPNAAQAYHRWVRTAVKENLPYDEFARQLLTSSGSNFRTPQVNFYRAVQSKTPEALASAAALTFLCERTAGWPAERLSGMSVFFSQVAYKGTGEWKEEIVFFDRRLGPEEQRGEPLTAVFPNGEAVQIPLGQDPRDVFADWLVNDQNPWFTRAIANRVWYWLLGRGIVDPPDDVRPDNPASNLPLLNYLADELIGADYDLRHLYRLILNSQTYQLACTRAESNSLAAEHFASYSVRRLDAEVLIDAICQITGTSESYSSIIPEPFTFLPEGHRAVALPDGSITSPFLEMFGRPSRDTGLESDRDNRLTARQALHLLNSNHLRNKLKRGPGFKDLVRETGNASERAELLYLTILSRRPTDEERLMVEGLCGNETGSRDVAWALINSDEFLFRH